MDHTTHFKLDAVDFVPETLIDAVIYGPEDERIGRVSHVHGMGASTKVVVDVGGFLGIGARSVMLDVQSLTFMRDDDANVHAVTNWTKEQFMALPEHIH